MVKAAREAKLSTSWANVNTDYEDALTQFVRTTLEPREGNLFLGDLVATQHRLARFGLFNSLSQTLCKLTAPGVPDIYQGNETWDFSLVDPDNRRPVDYEKRRRMLADLRAMQPGELRSLVDHLQDGRCKLFLTWKVLQFRREHADLFRRGDYIPLRVSGEHASNLCAFARHHERKLAITIVPRLYLRLLGEREIPPLGPDVWQNTVIELPRGHAVGADGLQSVLDGSKISASQHDGRPAILAADALHNFPVALLSSDSRAPAAQTGEHTAR
jgi:(1->4)-alpha-D-glucan 1-alpha-D-glucosylmutase